MTPATPTASQPWVFASPFPTNISGVAAAGAVELKLKEVVRPSARATTIEPP